MSFIVQINDRSFTVGTLTKNVINCICITTLTTLPNWINAAEAQPDYHVKPVAFTQVHFDDTFWAPRLATSSGVTIPVCFKRCEETGRIDNFAVAGGLIDGFYQGARYNDSDVYKVIEGAAYQLSVNYDPQLDTYLDDVIAKIAAAQEDDGYLSTLRTITPELDIAKTKGTPQHQLDMYGKPRWARCDHGHELYCVGHMYEAAVAHYQTTGKRSLLDVAIKNADLICKVFGPKEGQIRNVPGHEEIELALVKLYRTTGDRKYLDMSKFFLDERGHYNGRTVHMHNNSITYCQDDKPVIEQTEPHGHVVRAVYLYSGMADIAALTGDARYSRAINAIWDNIVSKRLYLIGSMGVHGYLEGFGPDYVLPNLHAYNETCATVGTALLNLRLFLLHADSKYIDVLERNLYNGVLSGVSLDGDTFFYPNPLASDGTNKKPVRSPWFSTACCPSNIARFMPSLPGYVYAHTDGELYVNLYVGGSANIELAEQTVKVTQKTNYPWDGQVNITVSPYEPADFSILLRIPGWARNQPVPSDLYRFMHDSNEKVKMKINGRATAFTLTKGYARIRRRWIKGDTITLDMPMPVRRVLSHPRVSDNEGLVAVQRGPVVYCAEWKDNGGRALDLVLTDNTPLSAEHCPDMLGGITTISARIGNRTLTMIPYYAWAHRGPGEMAVWLSRKWQRFTASHTEDGASPAAPGDGLEPENSADETVPHFSWGLYRTHIKWIQENFPRPRDISSLDVYWLDNESTGGYYRLPRSWQVLYRDADGWKPVKLIGKPKLPIVKDSYNRAAFEPVTATALRVEVRTSHEFAAGILEWKIN
jgi:DUF1680 family protein